MNEQKPIDVAAEVQPQNNPQALAVREQGGAVGRAMTLEELHRNLDFIRQVMAHEMKEGADYGKIPGCGDKPGLFQPGAQKLLMTFQLTDHVKKEEVRDLPHPQVVGHREYAFTVCVRSQTGREWDGVGTCTTLEAKYRYRSSGRKCPSCGKETIIKGKAEYGGGFICFAKKGGCGAKFDDNAPEIVSQPTGKAENENPADFYNTVRKMAFKRAIVHAAINATNTSELWSQDLEDIAANGGFEGGGSEYLPGQPAPPPAPATNRPPAAAKPPTRNQNAAQAKPERKGPPPENRKETAPKATPASRMRMLNNLLAAPGQTNRAIVAEYFEKAGMLSKGVELEDLPLAWVPRTQGQMKDLVECVERFARGEPATSPYQTTNAQ